MDCHTISMPTVAVQGGQYKLRGWLTESVAPNVKRMGQKEQEGVNVGYLKNWYCYWKVDLRIYRTLKKWCLRFY